MIKYWVRLVKLNSNRLLKQAYTYLAQKSSKENNWVSHVKKRLETSGFSYIWNNQFKDFDHNKFLNAFSLRIKDINAQNISKDIGENKKLSQYAKFKDNLSYEHYLDEIKSTEKRKALTRLRISNHKLRIETGRHQNIPREERICENCALNKIEDEKHFLLECSKYSSLRSQHLDKLTNGYNNYDTFTQLMKMNQKGQALP